MAQKPIDQQKINQLYELFEGGSLSAEFTIHIGTNRETVHEASVDGIADGSTDAGTFTHIGTNREVVRQHHLPQMTRYGVRA